MVTASYVDSEYTSMDGAEASREDIEEDDQHDIEPQAITTQDDHKEGECLGF